MKYTKYLSAFLATTIISAFLPTGTFAASEDKGDRVVYLHASGADYQGKGAKSTVYMGDTAEVFFAVDTPNKGDYISAEDSRNDSILPAINAATADAIAKYEDKVLTESQTAVTSMLSEISRWYYMPAGTEKDSLKETIEKSSYGAFLTKKLTELTDGDFESGALKPQAVLKLFDGSKYDDIFKKMYSHSYNYGYTYRYEYEFFYLGKVEKKVSEVNAAISEYNEKVAQQTEETEKTALKDMLLSKYNVDSLTFLTANADYSVSFDEDKFRVYTREGIHKERVVSGGDYFVGKDAEEVIRHIEPQYDLNGYTVRIYYDPAFFDLADRKNPLNYNTPGLNSIYTTESKDENVDSETEETPLDNGLWVYEMEVLPEQNGYASVAATIFASGIYFPNKKDGKAWYNLCSLPLIPKKTGRTQVYIERPNADINYPLTLFTKHDPNADDSFSPTFKITSQNGGYHTIVIEDKYLPSAPVATPDGGIYTERTEVRLTADEDCTIYYKRSGETSWSIYSYPDQDPATINPIVVDYTQSIICKAVRTRGITSDAERLESREVQFDYTIVPTPAYLWENDTAIINYSLYKNDVFEVYPSHSSTHYVGDIDPGRIFYYTFNEELSTNELPDGNDVSAEQARNPKTQWVRLSNNHPSIKITENVNLRLVVRKNDTYSNKPIYSDISEYKLGIKPYSAYDPDYTQGEVYTEKRNVTLKTDNTYPVEIYYTLDGSDPRTNGMLYTREITLVKGTEIKTVAKVPGKDIYSDVKLFTYDFANVPEDLVEAFFPAGTYEGSVNVVLKTGSHNNDIKYYVKEGAFDSTFVPDGALFENYENKNIPLNKNSTVYAKIGDTGEVYVFPYTVKPLEPIFAPRSQQFINAGSVDISTPTEDTAEVDYTLYYTTDGSDPADATNPNRKKVTVGQGEHDCENITVGRNMEIKAVVYASYGEYSKVVSHKYQVVENKPKKPAVTLAEGIYLKDNSSTEPLTTGFAEVPAQTNIYYTVSYDGDPVTTPYPGSVGTYHYNPSQSATSTPIPVRGKTVIKAVAIDASGVRSDIGTFEYHVVPEAPTAAPSGESGTLFVIPVNTVPGAEVTYTLTDEDNVPHSVSIVLPAGTDTFYISNSDGLPYSDVACTMPISTDASPKPLNGTTKLTLTAEVDGETSDTRIYTYTVNPSITGILPPYADKPEGLYEEIKQADGNYVLNVKLYSKTNGADIEWRDATGKTDANEGWTAYNPADGIKLKKHVILQCRAKVGTDVSDSVTYVYDFKPLAPVIAIKSGTYTAVNDNDITYNPARPDEDGDYAYEIRWRIRHGDFESPYDVYTRDSFSLTESSYVMAYVLNKATDAISDVVTNHYIIKQTDTNAYVSVSAPYNVSTIDRNLLSTGEYVNGIKLNLLVGNYTTHYIRYKYTYKFKDSNEIKSTSWNIYDPNMPIMTNASMEYIIVEAQVFRNDGYAFEKYTHRIDFTGNISSSPSYSGGGGGGSYLAGGGIRYTKDIFGREHKSHVGYISGYVDQSVRPEGDITREETAAILYRIYPKDNYRPENIKEAVFPDVQADRWSAENIKFMTDKEIISGYPDGTFRPGQNITRAEFASLVSRLAKLEYKDKAMNMFVDFDESHWAYDSIMALCEAGLMVGYDDSTFAPDNKITRAEAIVVVNKLLGRNPLGSYVKSLDLNPFNDLYKDKWYYVDVLEATITHDYTLDYANVEVKWENIRNEE